MAVAVDPAGQHQLAARVDLALALVEPFAERRDGLPADADVGFEAVGRGRDRAAANHEIEGLHISPRHSGAPPKARSRASATRYGGEPGIHSHIIFSIVRSCRCRGSGYGFRTPRSA